MQLHLTGGDGFGWALDEDVRTFRQALPATVELTPLAKADVVYSAWWEGLAQLGTAALVGKRIVCGFDNPLFHWITVPRFRGVNDLVDVWVAHSRQGLEQARALGYRCEFVPYCLRTEIFQPLAAGNTALRKKYGIPFDAYVIGNFQRDTEGSDLISPKLQKGPDVFAEIVRTLHAQGLPVHVLLAGPRRHWMRRTLTAYGVPFTAIGSVVEGDDLKANLLPRETLAELYNAVDLTLLTSRWEGGPYAILEAAGTRCKVVSTRVGLAEDVLEQACLFGDLPEAIAAVRADIERNTLAVTVAPQYQRVLDNHTTQALVPHVRHLLDEVAKLPPRAPAAKTTASALPASPNTTISARVVRLAQRLLPQPTPGSGLTVSMFREFVKPPYGGGNQFMLALRGEMERLGVRVVNNQIGEAIDGYLFDSLWFNQKLLSRLGRLTKPHVLHRIDGPIHLYRGKDKDLDDRIFEINREFATTSVIQSVFTLQRIYETGYCPVSPVVVRNAPDATIFNRNGKVPFASDRKVRLISSSWSDNPRKGGDVYKWLDGNLDWTRYEYEFLGRASAEFTNIRRMEPVPSQQLAQCLKNFDIYITASENDPCSNALIEALCCGLPAIFLRSGGHPELVGMGGLGFDRPEQIPALIESVVANYAAFQSCIQVRSITDVAKAYLACLKDR
jgi:glycosyltransferase involved in cell wall biosynthesis